MSGYTTSIDATPGLVAGTFDAKDVRLGMFFNALPGLFAQGDFAVSQRAAGANMSVDIAQGRALTTPAGTHQGAYLCRLTSGTAFNTSADGGYSWTAADATNPRIDILGIEAADIDEGGSYTGWKFRIIDGTPNAGATHQLEAAYWPSIPTDGSFVPVAAIRVPAAATTLTTANITNLNPIGGVGRCAASYVSAAETTTSATYARLATPDALLVYVPHTRAQVRLFSEAHWKISVASGTQGVTLFVDGAQLKYRNSTNGAPAAGGYELTSLGTFFSHLRGFANSGVSPATSQFFVSVAGATSDISDITTGLSGGGASQAPYEVMVRQLSVGWHLIEQRYKTSANTLTVQQRRMSAEVVA